MSYSKEVAEKAYQLAFEYEANKGSCSQCVLAAIMDTIGGIDESVFKAAQGLSGGTVSCGTGTCGALAGGITVLGSRVGRTRQEFDEDIKNRRVVEIGRKLADKFIQTYGGITCKEVQTANMGRSYNLADPVENQQFAAAGGHAEKCASVAGNAARWTIEILNELEADESTSAK